MKKAFCKKYPNIFPNFTRGSHLGRKMKAKKLTERKTDI